MTSSPPIVQTRGQEASLEMVVPVGFILFSMLYGVMLTQIFNYFQRFKRDFLLARLMVFYFWLGNTAYLFVLGYAAWSHLMTTAPRNLSIWTIISPLSSLFSANYLLHSMNSRQILLNTDKEKGSESPNVSGLPLHYVGSVRSATTPGRLEAGEKSPTQFDVFIVPETITDGLQTPDPPKIRNSDTDLKEISEDGSNSSLGIILLRKPLSRRKAGFLGCF